MNVVKLISIFKSRHTLKKCMRKARPTEYKQEIRNGFIGFLVNVGDCW